MKIFKILLYILFSIAILLLLVAIGSWAWVNWEYHLPSSNIMRQEFESHKADYIHLVSLIQKGPSEEFIGNDGKAYADGANKSLPREYRNLIREVGAQFVTKTSDGTIRFSLYGFGCMICSDSYMGVMYVPDHLRKNAERGWTKSVVTSLDSDKLPHYHGSVASGLYVIPIEPNWFVFRLEIQE